MFSSPACTKVLFFYKKREYEHKHGPFLPTTDLIDQKILSEAVMLPLSLPFSHTLTKWVLFLRALRKHLKKHTE